MEPSPDSCGCRSSALQHRKDIFLPCHCSMVAQNPPPAMGLVTRPSRRGECRAILLIVPIPKLPRTEVLPKPLFPPVQSLLLSAAALLCSYHSTFMLFVRPSLCRSLTPLQKPLVFTVIIIVRCSAPFYRLTHPFELLKINLISLEADTIAVVTSTGDTCF